MIALHLYKRYAITTRRKLVAWGLLLLLVAAPVAAQHQSHPPAPMPFAVIELFTSEG